MFLPPLAGAWIARVADRESRGPGRRNERERGGEAARGGPDEASGDREGCRVRERVPSGSKRERRLEYTNQKQTHAQFARKDARAGWV